MIRKALLIPYSFALMNWAAIAALYYFATDRKDLWLRPTEPEPQTR